MPVELGDQYRPHVSDVVDGHSRKRAEGATVREQCRQLGDVLARLFWREDNVLGDVPGRAVAAVLAADPEHEVAADGCLWLGNDAAQREPLRVTYLDPVSVS